METILSKIENLMNEQMHFISEAISQQNEARKNSAEEVLKTLKLIKAELIKTNNNKDYILDTNGEINTLIGMVEQRKKSIGEYKKGKREDLAEIETNEIQLIFTIEPKVKEHFDSLPNNDEVIAYTNECIKNLILEKGEDYTLSMKDMGYLVGQVKAKYKGADGNVIRKTLQEAIG
jgi:uncharacterized protein YqeY